MMQNQKRVWKWCGLLVLATLALPAQADIFTYTDEDGVLHISNVRQNRQYQLYLRSPGTRPKGGVSADASPRQAMRPRRDAYNQIIEDAAQTYAVDKAFLHAVITAESGYNPNAISPKGATGLMQLMPATARRYGVYNLRDPQENIRGGAQYLRDLLRMFNNDKRLALAAYNAGENAVIKYGYTIPPFSETLNYVPKVLRFYERLRGQV